MPVLPNSPHPTMEDIKITTKGIQVQLDKLKSHKAPGPDEISAHILKTASTELAPILKTIFQKSLDSGKLPHDWKKANVIPIHKKGNRDEAKNYRPISLTSIPAKIMEHVIASQIMNFLDKNNILYDLQHGFRKNRSCESQLIMTIEDLASNLNNHLQTDLAILDFAKAFDKVPHSRLLNKLHYYGIRNKQHEWIREFLTGRTQRVIVEGKASTFKEVTSGVPQGTVLGPILFLIFINDMPTGIKSKVRLFADDCLIYTTIKSPEDQIKLQSDLSQLSNWAAKWQMEFNVDKCHTMHITNKKQVEFEYKINNKTLSSVKHHPYLGIELDSNLKWNHHIENITLKGNRALNFLRRNLTNCPSTIKEKAYNTLVRPCIEYCSSVWDPHLETHTSNLERIQQQAARFVLNIPYRRDQQSNQDSGSSLVKRLNWQPLRDRRKNQRTTTIYKILNNKLAITPSYLPLPSTSITRKNHNKTYRPNKSTVDAHKYSLISRTIIDWNNLTQDQVNAQTIESFKSSLINK